MKMGQAAIERGNLRPHARGGLKSRGFTRIAFMFVGHRFVARVSTKAIF